ncbi:hypothetical protein JFU37_23365 [Pseudomonas sp. TH41]|uniref:hypothetical protein n=1 Tax=Pseudomonas sp. TH41 TaxID=2796405 RepID=UPI001914016A|nr:hypothetical protein [Pseudomonas sp. TH41]MBK5355429.1 hypothetical protein [Pseudomonas sp. TH41]
MKTFDDNNRKIHSVNEVVDKLGIAPQELVDLASTLKCIFLIEIPDNTEVHLKGDKLTKPSTSFAEAARRGTRTDQDTSLEINPEVEFFCLEASDYSSILQRGKLRKKEFTSVALLDKNTKITYLGPNQYVKRYVAGNDSPAYRDGTFFSCHRQDATKHPLLEKTITIRFDDILISTEDFQAIRKELSNKEPAYGKFKIEEWTSTMLAQLNEASTLFFASTKPNLTSNETIKEIETWLRARWGREDAGDILVKEAAKAILPNKVDTEMKSEVKISDYILGICNDYTSTTLTIINEAAFHNWTEMKSKNGKYKQDKALTNLLHEKYKLKGRLIKAASTIIRPDENKRIKMTSPY